jgi:heme-degrading monooxygenase HmoA
MAFSVRLDNEVTTLVNVFTVDGPDQQERLIEVLMDGAGLAAEHPGYLSSSIHRSLDGRRAVVYAQWRSPQAIEAFTGNPENREYFKRVAELAEFDPIVTEVIHVQSAELATGSKDFGIGMMGSG